MSGSIDLNKYSEFGFETSKTSTSQVAPVLRRLNLPNKDRTTQLANFICDTTLPQCISISKKFQVPGCEFSFDKGEILTLHFVYHKKIVLARDTATWKTLALPLYADQEYEILPSDPELDDKEYGSTQELIDASPLPSIVRVLDAHCSPHPQEMQEEGDIIEIQNIELDQERGKVVVGVTDGSKVRLSCSMTTSRYSTMISPEYHRLSRLSTRKFPQRVRIRDPHTALSPHAPKTEKVLRLHRLSEEKCIVATRNDDARIYSLPLTMKISFERVLDQDKYAMSSAVSLYPLVNTTWGITDPSQQTLPASMEAIPQPIEAVLRIWLASWEGQRRTENAILEHNTNLEKKVMEMTAEITRLNVDLNSYKILNRPKIKLESPPPRPPRKGDVISIEPTRPAPAAPTGCDKEDKKKRPMLPLPILRRDHKSNPAPSNKDVLEDESESDEYETVIDPILPPKKSGIKLNIFKRDKSEEEGRDPTAKEQGNEENVKMMVKYEKLQRECEELKLENQRLKEENVHVSNEMKKLQDRLDIEEYYTLVDLHENGTSTTSHERSDSKQKVLHGGDTEQIVCGEAERSHSYKRSTSSVSVTATKSPTTVTSKSAHSSTFIKTDVPPRVMPTFNKQPTPLAQLRPDLPSSREPQSGSKAPNDQTTTTLTKVNKPMPATRKTSPSSLPSSTDKLLRPQPRVQALNDMSVAEVGSFLEGCKLGCYAARFVENDVNGELLLSLDEQLMIEDLGLRAIDARKLSLALNKLISSQDLPCALRDGQAK